MRVYTLSSGAALTVGAPFVDNGIAHAANWADVWTAADYALFSVTATDVADPVPPAPLGPQVISDRQFFQQLAVQGVITQPEALAAVCTGTLPAALATLVASLPAEQQFAANMLLSGAVEFRRDHALVPVLSSAFGWTEAQTDDLWLAASQL
jgi:hypothetical protein